MVHNSELAADKLNEFILYALFIGGSIGGLASVYAQLQKAIGATETIFDLMEEQTEMIVDRVETVAVEIGDIVFNQVEFSYPSRSDVQVLNGLSFKIPKGKTIALVGKSGSGKRTEAFGRHRSHQVRCSYYCSH